MIRTGEYDLILSINTKIRDLIDRPYVLIDLNTTVLSINLAFCRCFGVEREKYEGRRLHELVQWPLDRDATKHFIAEVVGHGGDIIESTIPFTDWRAQFERSASVAVKGILLSASVVALLLPPVVTPGANVAQSDAADLLNELRSSLAVAKALAAISIDEALTLDSFQSQFFGRIDALFAVLGELEQLGGALPSLAEVVKVTVEAACRGSLNAEVSGPKINLSFRDVLLWALILNDLAALYLSRSGEQAESPTISWHVAGRAGGRKDLCMIWSGPLNVDAGDPLSDHGGFAARLVQIALSGSLHMSVNDRWLDCVIEIPRPQVERGS